MSNQPYESNPSDRDRAGGNRPPTIANLPAVPIPVAGAPRPTVGSHQCPNCGAWTPVGSSICAECGVRIQPKPQKVRCRLCGANAPTSLVICPRCGRELQPAPSRVLTWGAPTVLVLLFLLTLAPRWESNNPLGWVQRQVGAGRDWVDQMAQQLDPQITISTLPETVADTQVLEPVGALQAENPGTTPPVNSGNNGAIEQSVLITTSTLSNAGATDQRNSGNAGQSAPLLPEPAVVTPTTIIVAPTATAPPPPVIKLTATNVAPAPTATATTAPATPTNPPSATATPRNTTVSAIVQALPVVTTPVDTLVAAGVTTDSVPVTAKSILQPTPTLPSPTPEPPTATATPSAVTYTVRAGDTPGAIADRYGLTVNELLAANGLSLNDARRLRVGQVLLIAGAATPAPTATPTTASATATTSPTPTLPAAPTATNTPASTVRVDAPLLRSPENGSFLSCNSNNSLIWLPVAYIRESDQYLLHLGFLSGYNGDGSEQVTWVLEQWRPANVTLWDLDNGLCSLAPQAYGRQWRWYVEVVEAAGSDWQPVSPASVIGRFSWN